jgi:hypothetical protein
MLKAVEVGILVGFLLVGCSKRQASGPEPSVTAPASEQVTAIDGNAVEQASAKARTSETSAPRETDQPIQGVVDPFLTSQLRIFIQEKGRLPNTFAEFAGARLDSVPRLAKGLSFAIDRTTQEVKIVGQ